MIKKIDELSKKELKMLKRQIIENNNDAIIDWKNLYFIKVDDNIMLMQIEDSAFDSTGKTISILIGKNKYLKNVIDILIKEFHNIYILINNSFEIFGYQKNLYISNNLKDGIAYGVDRFLCSDADNINKPLDYYIDSQTPELDFNNLKYYNLNSREFEEFVRKNYTYNQSLFGLHYTSHNSPTHNNNYLFCTLKNKFNLETIVGVIKYNGKYMISENLCSTYIAYVETNYFYWNKGVFNKMLEVLLSNIPEQPLILSSESEMGQIIGTHKKTLEKVRMIRPTIEVVSESEALEYFRHKGLIK